MLQDNTYFNPNNETKNVIEQHNVAENNNQFLDQPTYAISSFKTEQDNQPKTINLTWSKFCQAFSTHQPRQSKHGGRAWSPATYKLGDNRGNKNVINITMAVIDVDNGTTLNAIQKRLIGFTYLMHSSYSHTKATPKYRVILPLQVPVATSDWPLCWLRINSWLGNINDPATKDASRIYYTPACPVNDQDIFVEIGEGKLLDIQELPAIEATNLHSSTQHMNVGASYIHIDGIEASPSDPLGTAKQLEAMQSKCQFIQWASHVDNQATVSEPSWMAMLSNQSRFESGDEACHEASKHHPEYDENQTDRRIERARNGSAPITCGRIQSLGFKGCPTGGCKLPSGEVTKAPAGLGVWANKQRDVINESVAAEITIENSMPNDLVKYIDRFHRGGIKFVSGSFYGYSEGYWPRLDEQADIRKSVAQFLGSKAEPRKISELVTLCKDFYASKEQDVAPNLNLICLENGTLDVAKGALLEFSPTHHLASKNNISWDPTAKCKRWLEFLDQIFEHDADKLEKISFLKMWFGYCLVPDNSLHKFLWMVGGGGNGKSVLLSILTKLVGEANVSHAYIERLDEKYVRAELQGKLLNISSEMSSNATLADGYLKAIVAGDIIEAERKYMPSFSFKPFVRLIGATNHLPRLLDLSDGFFRRAVIISFNRQFLGSDCDPTLEGKLIGELPGILAWAVEGLKELRQATQFTIPVSSIEALTEYRTESDPVKLFTDECLKATDVGGINPTRIYTEYRQWCSDNGFQAMSIVRFGRGLSALGFKSHRSGGSKYWLVKAKADNGYFFDQVAFDERVKLEKNKAVLASSFKL